MKTPLVLLLSLLVPISFCAADEIVSIDASAGLLTVQQRGALKSYRLKNFTDITINGQKCTAFLLKPGMDVTLMLSDPQTASKVTAKGNVAPATTPVPVPAQRPATSGSLFQDKANAQLKRKLVIKASIDGDDKFIIQNGTIQIQHGGWQKPIDISVNGIPWKPQWTDKNSDYFTAGQFAPFAGAAVTVKKSKGRGEAIILEPPTDTNGQKLLVHFKDDGGGASEFEVRIDW